MLDVFKKSSKVGFVGNVQKLYGSFFYDHAGVVSVPKVIPGIMVRVLVKPRRQVARHWSAVTAACVLVETFLHLMDLMKFLSMDVRM